jgi:hypothetical protein
MMNDDDEFDHTPIGDLVRRHRERLGLTPYALAGRTTKLDSAWIRRVESGIRERIGRRSVALALARALELDPWETDEFLFVAGHAPMVDWQAIARDLLLTTNTSHAFLEMTAPYYEELDDSDTPEDADAAPTTTVSA